MKNDKKYEKLFKKFANYECENQMTLEDFGISLHNNKPDNNIKSSDYG